MKQYVKICDVCQLINSIKNEKTLHFIWIFLLWKKIDFDIVYMSLNAKKNFLIVTKNDFFDLIKARTLFETKTWKMTKSFWENVICRHDCFEKLVMNEKLKNKKLMNKLIEKLAIKKIIISTYHSQTNEIIEQNIAFLLTFFQKWLIKTKSEIKIYMQYFKQIVLLSKSRSVYSQFIWISAANLYYRLN